MSFLAVAVLLAADPLDAFINLDRAAASEELSQTPGDVSLRVALAELPHLWANGDYLAAAALLPQPIR